MARRRGRTCQLLLLFTLWATDEEAAGAPGHAALAHRTRLSRSQGRAGARPLRRPPISRLAPSRLGRLVLLRVRHRRTCAAFSPLGPKAAGRRRAVHRGLSVTSPTASPP